MGRLTTHVLDTAGGRPGAGIRVTVWRIDGERRQVAQATTNSDGRVDKPLLEGDAFARPHSHPAADRNLLGIHLAP